MALRSKTFSTVTTELLTVCDYVQYAVTRFQRAKLAYGHGTAHAFDEAAFIVLETLHLPIDQLKSYWKKRLTIAQRQAVLDMIEGRIRTRKPASYLLNKAYIQGIPFYVDERVIVPRSFIGELLCTEDGPLFIKSPEKIRRVLDLCTGSGCLAILAAHIFSKARVDAVDISADAVAVAKKNVKQSGMQNRITLFKGDLFTPLKSQRYDLIITNPPYVDAKAMKALPKEYHHEPALALSGGKDGLDIVRRILEKAPEYLTPNGGLLCEIGRGKEILEKEYPKLPFLWLDTRESEGEVFWITRKQLVVQ